MAPAFTTVADWFAKHPQKHRLGPRGFILETKSGQARKPLMARYGVALLLIVMSSPALRADPAQHDYKLGMQAERLKHYAAAFAYFRQALDLQPKRIRYILAFQRSRFEAALERLQQGDALEQKQQYAAALQQFQQALAYDPSNFAAAQQYRRLRRQLTPTAAKPVTRKRRSAIARRLAMAAGPEELGPVSATPITLRLNADSRIAYETLGRLAHINILFDRTYQPLPVSLHLRQVSLLEALRIVGLESKSFYTVVTPNTIYVASNNIGNRTRLQQLVVQTFYLHNLTSPADVNQVAQTVRTLLNANRIQAIPDEMALIMRDTPDRVAAAEQIIRSLDQSPPEVEVDIQVLEVSRDLIRDLGIQPPSSVTVGLQTGTTTTSSSSSTSSSTSSTPLPTFNTLRHLTGSNYSVTISPATLNLLLSDDRTHTLQEPQLRSIQGQKAVEKIGERIPVATGSFQPGIGGVGINPLVNTQFQYQSVGVNITLTPYIHPNNDVTLKSDIEISSVIANTTIGGITEPIIGQRIINHTIELENGQSNVLGGILTEQNIKNLSGIPGLSQIPLLKWLFSTTHTELQRDEVLVVMTPHIIRPWRVSRQASRAIDTGTQNNVYLHELPAAQAAPAAGPAPPSRAIPPAGQPPAAHTTQPTTPPGTPTQQQQHPAGRSAPPRQPGEK